MELLASMRCASDGAILMSELPGALAELFR